MYPSHLQRRPSTHRELSLEGLFPAYTPVQPATNDSPPQTPGSVFTFPETITATALIIHSCEVEVACSFELGIQSFPFRRMCHSLRVLRNASARDDAYVAASVPSSATIVGSATYCSCLAAVPVTQERGKWPSCVTQDRNAGSGRNWFSLKPARRSVRSRCSNQRHSVTPYTTKYKPQPSINSSPPNIASAQAHRRALPRLKHHTPRLQPPPAPFPGRNNAPNRPSLGHSDPRSLHHRLSHPAAHFGGTFCTLRISTSSFLPDQAPEEGRGIAGKERSVRTEVPRGFYTFRHSQPFIVAYHPHPAFPQAKRGIDVVSKVAFQCCRGMEVSVVGTGEGTGATYRRVSLSLRRSSSLPVPRVSTSSARRWEEQCLEKQMREKKWEGKRTSGIHFASTFSSDSGRSTYTRRIIISPGRKWM